MKPIFYIFISLLTFLIGIAAADYHKALYRDDEPLNCYCNPNPPVFPTCGARAILVEKISAKKKPASRPRRKR